jgi:hypothetical protein
MSLQPTSLYCIVGIVVEWTVLLKGKEGTEIDKADLPWSGRCGGGSRLERNEQLHKEYSSWQ